MGSVAVRRLEFRKPILGRLMWGWVGLAGLLVISTGWIALDQIRKPKIGRVALNVQDQLTKLSPPAKSLHLGPPPEAVNVTNSDSGALRYAQTSFEDSRPSREENTQAPTHQDRGVQLASLAPANAQNQTRILNDKPDNQTGNAVTSRGTSLIGPRTYKVPNANSLEADDIAPPGQLVIKIDGRNVDDPKKIAPKISLGSYLLPAIKEPIPALLQSSPYGEIPQVAKNGLFSAKYYTQPFAKKSERSAMAFIVSGLGLNEEVTMRAIDELPGEVSLAFAPYAKDIDKFTKLARAKGHEILLEVPMEGHLANSKRQLGSAGLLTSQSPANNIKRLDWILSRTQGFFGVTNYLGSKFASDEASITPAINYLSAHGVAYIDDTGAATRDQSKGIVGKDFAHIISSASSQTNAEQMQNDLAILRGLAEENGFALGKLSASKDNIDVLNAYLVSLAGKKIDLAPASAVLYVQGTN